MDLHEQDVAAFTVVGLASRVSNSDPAAIEAAWGAFFARNLAAEVPDRTSDDIFALYTDYDHDATGPYTLVIGYAVPAGSSGTGDLHTVIVPAARYAVLIAQGEQPAATLAAWQTVWASDLSRAYTVDFDQHAAEDRGATVRVHVATRGTGNGAGHAG